MYLPKRTVTTVHHPSVIIFINPAILIILAPVDSYKYLLPSNEYHHHHHHHQYHHHHHHHHHHHYHLKKIIKNKLFLIWSKVSSTFDVICHLICSLSKIDWTLLLLFLMLGAILKKTGYKVVNFTCHGRKKKRIMLLFYFWHE